MLPGQFYRVPKQNAAEYPVVTGTRCVSVSIPDDDRFLPVLAAMVAELGNTWSSVGDVAARRAWANMWQEAYAATDWEGCMSCDDVADCIENDQNVQDAITNVYNQHVGGNPMPPGVSGKNLLPEITDCDRDILWGAINQLVDSMHQNNIDAFEVFEEVTDIFERAALLISAVPVIETFPVDEAIDYIQGLWTDELFEAYNANDTTAYRDALKCDLFCLAVANNCVLSIDDVFQYFMGRIGAVGFNTLIDIVTYVTAGTWAGTQINDTFFAAQIMFMKYGNQFFDLQGIYTFELALKIGSRDPSDVWELLCEECGGDYCKTWDMSLGLQGWEIFEIYGEVEPGGIGSNDTIAISLYRDDFEGVKIKSVRIRVTPNVAALQIGTGSDGSQGFTSSNTMVGSDITIDTSADSNYNSCEWLYVKGSIEGLTIVTGLITEIEVCYYGEELPF